MSVTPWKQILLGDLAVEMPPTRAMLEAVPDDRLTWKAHDKSWSIAEVVGHIANIPHWQAAVLQFPEFDLTQAPPPESPPTSIASVIERFDANVATLRSGLEAIDDAALEEGWTLRHGDHVLFTNPRADVIRATGIRHIVHHRGQLSVYLRLLDIPVPSTFGPTADSPPPNS